MIHLVGKSSYSAKLNVRRMEVLKIILKEPYRLFFPLGWLMGITGASYWLLASANMSVAKVPFYHGAIQIELFCSAFAVGFLLTALPKFLAARTTTAGELVCFSLNYLILAYALLTNSIAVAQWSFMIFILLLIR